MAFAMYGWGALMSGTRFVHVSVFPVSGESSLCFVVPLMSCERYREFAPVSFES